jgi:hypothetical protein
MGTPPLIQESQPTPASPARKGAIFGGWVSLLVAIGSIFVPFPTFWLYVPLILAAFICGIVAIAQGKAGSGIVLLLCSLVLPPIAIAVFWTAILGAGSVLSHSTNFWSTLTNTQIATALAPKDASPTQSTLTQSANHQRTTDEILASTCANNLRLIDSAKQQWALEHGKAGTDSPVASDLEPYLAVSGMPKCPVGGIYSINAVRDEPTCSIPGHEIGPPGKIAKEADDKIDAILGSTNLRPTVTNTNR